jgi:hypothetical protein
VISRGDCHNVQRQTAQQSATLFVMSTLPGRMGHHRSPQVGNAAADDVDPVRGAGARSADRPVAHANAAYQPLRNQQCQECLSASRAGAWSGLEGRKR